MSDNDPFQPSHARGLETGSGVDGHDGRLPMFLRLYVGRSSQILESKQCNPLICDIKEDHKASTQTKFH